MLMTSTEVYAILGLSTSVDTYLEQVDYYIPIVLEDIVEYTNRNFTDANHWIESDELVISSSNKTITIEASSTYDWEKTLKSGDTVLVKNSWFNNNYFTVSSFTTHVLTLSETPTDENSTDYDVNTRVYRCDFDKNTKRIAAKMVWHNIKNSTSVQGDISNESYGEYSRTYRIDHSVNSYGIYPRSLLAGLRRKVRVL